MENFRNSMDLVEPYIRDNIKCDAHIKLFPSSHKLLTYNRLPVAFNLIYLQYKEKNYNYSYNVYLDMIRGTSIGSYVESVEQSEKAGMPIFIEDFRKTYSSILFSGFDPSKSILPLSNDGSILNGTHRLASAIYLDKPVYAIETTLEPVFDDYLNLYKRNVKVKFIEAAVIKFLEYSENTHVAFLWPSSRKNHHKIEELFSKIVYKKKLKLNSNGAFNLLYELYHHMDEWVGSEENGFSGIRKKLFETFTDFEEFTVIFFQCDSLNNVREIKNKARQISNIGYSSIHITDTKSEANDIGKLLLNVNGLNFINYSSQKNKKTIKNKINTLKEILNSLDVNLDDFLVDGSTILELFGIRAAADIDYFCNKNIDFNSDLLIEAHDSELIYHNVSKCDLIYDPDYFFVYNGVKFIAMKQLYLMKSVRKDPKDIADCILIDRIIPVNDSFNIVDRLTQISTYYILYTKQSLFNFMFKFLKNTVFYPYLRKIWRIIFK